MPTPWLSVILPTYNGATYLREALDSVRLQADPQIEVIAIDDGSVDGTLEILDCYAGFMPLQVLRRPRAGSWAANVNLGLDRANGSYISILHQDDVWMPGRLSKIKSLLADASSEPNLILHPSWFIDSSGKRLGLWNCPISAQTRMTPETIVSRLLVQNFISVPAPIFRREVARKVGGLEPTFWYATDWDFWLKMAAEGKTIYLPTPFCAFRVHPSSQSITGSRQIENVQRELQGVLDKHLHLWKGKLPQLGSITKAAKFSIRMNLHLMKHFHRMNPSWPSLAWSFLSLGPLTALRYLRDSVIVPRLSARIRCNLVKNL